MELGLNRRPMVVAIATVVAAAFLFGCVNGIFVIRYIVSSATNASEKELIVEYLNKRMHDSSSLEIVEWHTPRHYVPSKGKPDPPKYGVNIYHVRIRAKNAFGAKVLNVMKFEIENGKILEASEDDWPSD